MATAAKKTPKTYDIELTGGQVASLYRVTPQAVTAWFKHSGAPRRVGGKYRLREVIAWREMRLARDKGGNESLERLKLDLDRLDAQRAAVAEVLIARCAAIPGELAEELAGKDKGTIQQALEAALDRLTNDLIAAEVRAAADEE